jgi:hypothetical protein
VNKNRNGSARKLLGFFRNGRIGKRLRKRLLFCFDVLTIHLNNNKNEYLGKP